VPEADGATLTTAKNPEELIHGAAAGVMHPQGTGKDIGISRWDDAENRQLVWAGSISAIR